MDISQNWASKDKKNEDPNSFSNNADEDLTSNSSIKSEPQLNLTSSKISINSILNSKNFSNTTNLQNQQTKNQESEKPEILSELDEQESKSFDVEFEDNDKTEEDVDNSEDIVKEDKDEIEGEHDAEEQEEVEGEEGEGDEEDAEDVEVTTSPVKRRGRPKSLTNLHRKKKIRSDEEEDDDVDDTVSGEEKVTIDGVLLGGREYNIKTFVLPRHPTRLYMLAMDVSRLLGYRDSYMFFSKVHSVNRVNASNADKDYFIDNKFIPSKRKFGPLPLCSARSVFKEFGYRVIQNGKKIEDDYWPEGSMHNRRDDDIEMENEEDFGDEDDSQSQQLFNGNVLLTEKSKLQLFQRASISCASFNSKLRSERKLNHFDIHTNVEQIPRKTQIEHFKIEMKKDDHSPNKVEDYIGVKGFRTGGIAKIIDDDDQWNIVYRSDDPYGKYPLALLPGQRRDSVSIFQHRFSHEDAVRLHNLAILNSSTEEGKNKVDDGVDDEDKNKPAVEEKIYLCGVSRKRDDGTCMNKVSGEGELCPLHSAIKRTNKEQKILCCHCESEEAPPKVVLDLNKDGDEVSNEYENGSNAEAASRTPKNFLLFCSKCRLRHHPQCVELEDEDLLSKILTYSWHCPNCKLCSMCDDAGDEGKMIFCDTCDRGYHTYCVDPPLEGIPEGKWMCSSCCTCVSCKKRQLPENLELIQAEPLKEDGDEIKVDITNEEEEIKEDENNEKKGLKVHICRYCTVGKNCFKKFKKGKFCPICMKTFSSKDVDVPMVCCDSCDRWVHESCDEENLTEDILSSEDSKYTCLLCDEEKRNSIIKNYSGIDLRYKLVKINQKFIISPLLK
ncbi:PHD finger protein 10 [Clydaea vesicula]|uniref:PHD finger protein 10 n=1 Tax=Clydaea vesicula TaxID=447962 RepID=A0AAD5U537_9FUNG|nr:PHD finger protein 10 [Clydaea vesicula]KAJ3391739.1 PHD finger protein 10 [Lobulomyces angularis]